MEQVETKADVLASQSVGRNEASTDTSEHPVDALAVLDRAMTQVRHCHEAHEIQEARKAIAELIEADKEYDKAYAAAVANPAKEAWLADAEERRAAALARVGGGK